MLPSILVLALAAPASAPSASPAPPSPPAVTPGSDDLDIAPDTLVTAPPPPLPYWVGLELGFGFGHPSGTTEGTHIPVPVNLAPSLLHFEPEVGWAFQPRLAAVLRLRAQIGTGAQVAGSHDTAFAGLVGLRVGGSRDRGFGLDLRVEAGVGRFRQDIDMSRSTLPQAVSDSASGGPLLAGAALGASFTARRLWVLRLEAAALAGYPDRAWNLDISAGVYRRF